MSLTIIIEVVIGVLFVWILLALITSQVSEWLAALFKWRAKMLETTIRNMLGCESLCKDFYGHPLIKGLHSDAGKRIPSYIPKNQFALVVFDVFIQAGTKESEVVKTVEQVESQAGTVYNQLRAAVDHFSKKIGDDKQGLAHAMDTLFIDVKTVGEKVQEADQALGQARKRMEAWFDDAMDRLSGAYKRRAQLSAILIGMVLAFAINADSLAIANALWTQPAVRDAVVAQAEQLQLPENQTSPSQEQTLEYVNTLGELSLPLGWGPENIPSNFNSWIVKVGGILLSGAAAAQGAPFWFEILRKLLDLRKPAAKTEENAA
ncbi:MAG: hypothetical protein H6636_06715 [Anaerolineales bacterium]|nr:hypothetical protein [Anaerolineales bacterium]